MVEDGRRHGRRHFAYPHRVHVPAEEEHGEITTPKQHIFPHDLPPLKGRPSLSKAAPCPTLVSTGRPQSTLDTKPTSGFSNMTPESPIDFFNPESGVVPTSVPAKFSFSQLWSRHRLFSPFQRSLTPPPPPPPTPSSTSQKDGAPGQLKSVSRQSASIGTGVVPNESFIESPIDPREARRITEGLDIKMPCSTGSILAASAPPPSSASSSSSSTSSSSSASSALTVTTVCTTFSASSPPTTIIPDSGLIPDRCSNTRTIQHSTASLYRRSSMIELAASPKTPVCSEGAKGFGHNPRLRRQGSHSTLSTKTLTPVFPEQHPIQPKYYTANPLHHLPCSKTSFPVTPVSQSRPHPALTGTNLESGHEALVLQKKIAQGRVQLQHYRDLIKSLDQQKAMLQEQLYELKRQRDALECDNDLELLLLDQDSTATWPRYRSSAESSSSIPSPVSTRPPSAMSTHSLNTPVIITRSTSASTSLHLQGSSGNGDQRDSASVRSGSPSKFLSSTAAAAAAATVAAGFLWKSTVFAIPQHIRSDKGRQGSLQDERFFNGDCDPDLGRCCMFAAAEAEAVALANASSSSSSSSPLWSPKMSTNNNVFASPTTHSSTKSASRVGFMHVDSTTALPVSPISPTSPSSFRPRSRQGSDYSIGQRDSSDMSTLALCHMASKEPSLEVGSRPKSKAESTASTIVFSASTVSLEQNFLESPTTPLPIPIAFTSKVFDTTTMTTPIPVPPSVSMVSVFRPTKMTKCSSCLRKTAMIEKQKALRRMQEEMDRVQQRIALTVSQARLIQRTFVGPVEDQLEQDEQTME
ncbi:hypothetical protein BGW38_002236, partial [Lunasporangiospora selenospora]